MYRLFIPKYVSEWYNNSGGYDMCETDIGKRLVGLRIIKGVSQDTVAESCNISRVALSRYENGTRMPRIEISSRLAEYYGVSVDYILGRDEAPKPPAPPINPHTYYAQKFGDETQSIVDHFLDLMASMPDEKSRQKTAEGAVTLAHGILAECEHEGKA